MLTFSGVASNFAGVPLAFAFIATIGNTGLITRAVSYITGTNIVQHGWKVYNLWGLSAGLFIFPAAVDDPGDQPGVGWAEARMA